MRAAIWRRGGREAGRRVAESGGPGKRDRKRGRSRREEARERKERDRGASKGYGREARFPVRGTGAV